MDAVGSNIRVDSRGREVMRILPRTHDDVNEEWISDKTRFVLGRPAHPAARPALYPRIRQAARRRRGARPSPRIAQRIKATAPERIGVLIGDLVGAEEMFALKELAIGARRRAVSTAARTDRRLGERGGRAGYLFNPTIAGIDEADAILLIGTNPRREAPVLNARIRKRWRKGNVPDRRHRREGRSHL